MDKFKDLFILFTIIIEFYNVFFKLLLITADKVSLSDYWQH